VYDTKHGTNKYKLKLGCFVTVAPSGVTKVLAASLVSAETMDSFKWVFERFLSAFRVPPAVIFTDSDAGMAAAYTAVLQPLGVLHFLCIWHLSKNVLTHINRPLFSSPAGHQAFMNGWWQVCKTSDRSSCETFDSEWEELLAPIRAGAQSSERKSALEWLSGLHERRKQWAARFTWQTLTLGIHSTQRGEAVHSSLSRWCTSSMRLIDLIDKLDRSAEDVDTRAATRETQRSLRLLKPTQSLTTAPIIASAASIATPYAVSLMEAQRLQSVQYVVKPGAGGSFLVDRVCANSATPTAGQQSVEEQAADASDGVGGSPAFSTARSASLSDCSCQGPTSSGLPCRHIFAVAAQLQVNDACELAIVPHWRLKDEAQRQALVRGLLTTVPPGRRPHAGPPPGGMSRPDRFALLMSEFRAVAAGASESPESMEWALGEVHRVAQALRSSMPVAAAGARKGGRGGSAGAATRPVARAVQVVVAAHQEAQAPAPAAGGTAAPVREGANTETGKRLQKCSTCGMLGHRNSNMKFHPRPEGPSEQPIAGAAAALPAPLLSLSAGPAVDDDAEAREADEMPLSHLPAGVLNLQPLPAGAPPPARAGGQAAKRGRDSLPHAEQAGGQDAPPVGVPAGVPSRGRPAQKRIRSSWEGRK